MVGATRVALAREVERENLLPLGFPNEMRPNCGRDKFFRVRNRI